MGHNQSKVNSQDKKGEKKGSFIRRIPIIGFFLRSRKKHKKTGNTGGPCGKGINIP